MDKSGLFGMGVQQGVSFSRPFMRAPAREAVFWPGCALMGLDGAILERTLMVLRRAEPDMGLCSCCCGQPSRYLFPEKYEARRASLIRFLKSKGIKRVYTACPNCALQLRELDAAQVLPIWSILDANLRPEDVERQAGQACFLHDPCPMRQDGAEQAAVRSLLKKAGVSAGLPEHSGPNTRCCGNFHMLRATDPEKSEKMRRSRLAELPEDKPIASYCEGCLDAFRSAGRETIHLLELLFGKSAQRGWGNRLAFTGKAGKR